MKKILYFEGAGMPETERSGDVGNCRIRTASRTESAYIWRSARGNRHNCKQTTITKTAVLVV